MRGESTHMGSWALHFFSVAQKKKNPATSFLKDVGFLQGFPSWLPAPWVPSMQLTHFIDVQTCIYQNLKHPSLKSEEPRDCALSSSDSLPTCSHRSAISSCSPVRMVGTAPLQGDAWIGPRGGSASMPRVITSPDARPEMTKGTGKRERGSRMRPSTHQGCC